MTEVKWVEYTNDKGEVEMRREDHDELNRIGLEGPHDPAVVITDEEIAAMRLELLRRERDKLLAKTDWSQGADVPADLKNKYTTYRQALRDITNSYDSYLTVTWPTKPS